MNVDLTSALIGELGVLARVSKAGVKARDQRTRPPMVKNQQASKGEHGGDLLWCDIDM